MFKLERLNTIAIHQEDTTKPIKYFGYLGQLWLLATMQHNDPPDLVPCSEFLAQSRNRICHS